MAFKKLSLICFTIISVFMVMNFGFSIESLNSCGKNSGWVNGETYLINFSTIPNTYSNNYCFRFDTSYNGINFEQITENINIESSSAQLDIFRSISGNIVLNGFELYNLKINDTTTTGDVNLVNVYRTGSIGAIFEDSLIENSTLLNFNALFFSTDRGKYDNNTVYQTVFDGQYLFRGLINPTNIWVNNYIDRTFLFIDDLEDSNGAVSVNNFYEDSVIIDKSDSTLSSISPNSYFLECIIEGFEGVDTNDDNMQDSTVYANHINSSMFKTIQDDYTFIQNIEEGNPFDVGGKYLLTVNSEAIGSPNTLQFQSNTKFSSEGIFLLYDNFNGLILTSGTEIKSIFGEKINMQDQIGSVFTLGTQYKGLMRVSGNNLLISDLTFNKFSDDNNAHIISDLTGVTRNDITISDNYFDKSDDNYKFLNNYVLKLVVNNLNISNNIFNMSTSFNNGYEILDIDSTSPLTNKIKLNEFYLNAPISTTSTLIFTENMDSLFYNNYLDSGINITEEVDTSGLNITPLVGYLYDVDGKIYYYYIGNYYVDNTGCVDGDGDGFCDSSYTSGTVTDNNPLSSYPFDFTSHLLTAELVVDSTLFNITLSGDVSDNSTIEVTDINSVLNIGFSHNSDFPDLICDYVVDGVAITGTTINSPSKGINYNISVDGWTEKEYAYRVECYNDLTFQSSEEITFTIQYSSTEPPVDGDGDGDDGVDVGDVTIDGLFSEDYSESSSNLVGLFGLLETPFGYLILLGFATIFVAIFMFIFVLAKVLIGGK